MYMQLWNSFYLFLISYSDCPPQRWGKGRLTDLPLCCRISTIQWIFELNNFATFLSQLPLILHIKLNQLGQRGKFFSAVQIVEVAFVLNFDVCDLAIASENEKQTVAPSTIYPAQKSPMATVSFVLLIYQLVINN